MELFLSIDAFAVPRTDQIVFAIGSFDTEFASYLEFGTSKMAARPFVLATFRIHREQVMDIISHPFTMAGVSAGVMVIPHEGF